MCALSKFCNVDIKDEATFDRRKFFIIVNFLQVFKTLEGDGIGHTNTVSGKNLTKRRLCLTFISPNQTDLSL